MIKNKKSVLEEESEESRNPFIVQRQGRLRRQNVGLLPPRTKTIKVDIRTWDSLKSLKKENETFDDVIKELLMQRTKAIGNENVKAIKYSRKVLFLKTGYGYKSIGVEFEYNDVKNQKQDFILDLRIKKVFHGKRILNPSIFFGLDSHHKHLSPIYLNIYLKCVALALEKEFKLYPGMYSDEDFEDIAQWRKLYYDYNLSEESFINDVEKPLILSEEEHLTEEYKKRISESISGSFWEI